MSFEEALACAVDVHNTTPHISVGETPFFMMFGMEPCFPGRQRFAKEQDQQQRVDAHMAAPELL